MKWSEINKLAGVLSTPKDTLPPKVFNSINKLHPEVRKEIMKRFHDFWEKEGEEMEVKGMYIQGSITGYKWSESSDIDVNVAVFPFKPEASKIRKTREINEQNLSDSTHPINYFISEWTPKLESNFAKSDFGVYDIFADGWIAPPGDRESIRHPQKEFWAEIQKAEMIFREFERRAGKYDALVLALEELKSKDEDIDNPFYFDAVKRQTKLVEDAYDGLLRYVDEIDENRKASYSKGWGVPREGQPNIIFKYLEHGPHGDLFYELKEFLSKKRLAERQSEDNG